MGRARIVSARATAKIEALHALVVTGEDGREGVLRRDTPFGTIPWIADDRPTAEKMLALAASAPAHRGVRIVTFTRVEEPEPEKPDPRQLKIEDVAHPGRCGCVHCLTEIGGDA